MSAQVGPPGDTRSFAEQLVPNEICLTGISPSSEVQSLALTLTGSGVHPYHKIGHLKLQLKDAGKMSKWADVLSVFDPTAFELAVQPADEDEVGYPTTSSVSPDVASRMAAVWTRLSHVVCRGRGSLLVVEGTGKLAARSWVLGGSVDAGAAVVGELEQDPLEQVLIWEEDGKFVEEAFVEAGLGVLPTLEKVGRTAFQVIVGRRRR